MNQWPWEFHKSLLRDPCPSPIGKKKKKFFYTTLHTKLDEISISPYHMFNRFVYGQLQKLLGCKYVYTAASSKKRRVSITCKRHSCRKKRMALVLEAQKKTGHKRTHFYLCFCQSCYVIQLIWPKYGFKVCYEVWLYLFFCKVCGSNTGLPHSCCIKFGDVWEANNKVPDLAPAKEETQGFWGAKNLHGQRRNELL